MSTRVEEEYDYLFKVVLIGDSGGEGARSKAKRKRGGRAKSERGETLVSYTGRQYVR